MPMMRCVNACFIQILYMTSVRSMNFSKNQDTDYWLEVDNLYDRSDLDGSILVKSFGKDKLLKHFYHCTEQGRTSDLCVHVMNKVTQEEKTNAFKKLKMFTLITFR